MARTRRTLPWFVKYLRAIGAVGLILSVAGILLGSPDFFWYATALLYIGLLAMEVDLWYEPDLAKRPLIRGFAALFIFGLAILFTWGIVFYPASLKITATSYEGLYKPGQSQYGIIWDDSMSDLRVDIFNPSNRDYEHLDTTLIFDTAFIRSENQITNVPGVSLLPEAHALHIRYTDDNGLLKSEENKPFAAHNRLRILCDRLPPKVNISLILAVSDLSPAVRNQWSINKAGTYLFTHPRQPPFAPFVFWVRIRPQILVAFGSWSVTNRPFEFGETAFSIKQE